jgi:hypothetical protein
VRRTVYRSLLITSVVLAFTGAAAGWLAYRAHNARSALAALRQDGTQLQAQLAGYDLAAAGPTLARLRLDAAEAHTITSDPVWSIAAQVPLLGRRLRAASVGTASLAAIADAARPLEAALPRLDPSRSGAARKFDIEALENVAQSLPAVSAAISAGALRVGELDASQLPASDAAAVRQLQRALGSARRPMADAVPVFSLLPSMLGADRSKTWMILLQQDAEARGTGGLIGAYAVMRTKHGQIELKAANSRQVLDRGPRVPSATMPDGLRQLWGPDLTEWAGLNGSPNFPWTGNLVASGWKAQGRAALDYVAAVDPYTVAAMMSATGPVTVRGISINQANAVRFLSRDVYARWKDPHQVDSVVTELVRSVFARFTAGDLDVPKLIQALKKPAEQRRLLIWAANPQEENQLSKYRVSGALPMQPGPFAMAVVNNGGGNKLDAYLKVHTDYQPGECIQGNRVGWITVNLTNTAPRTGLPAYVTNRSDLAVLGESPQHIPGSNRIVLDIYGPVSGDAGVTTVDGQKVAPISSIDSNHSVWRVFVPIDPGQKRTVRVVVLAPAVDGEITANPLVMAQPMVIPATTSSQPATACRSASRNAS